MRRLFQKNACLKFLLFLLLITGHQLAFSQIITTVAGNGTVALSGNGGPATQAGLPLPRGICTDASGNIYVTSENTIRKIDAGTGIITHFAGNGAPSSTGDGGLAVNAGIYQPFAVCSDGSGNIYIAEYQGHRIRKVSPSGMITTVAGNGSMGFAGDGGPATSATLFNPIGIAADASGNLYIADYNNNRIRKVNAASGIISTIAGTGFSTFTGDGGPATNASLAGPHGVFVNQAGDVFIAESYWGVTSRIRKIAAGTGTISTVAGSSVNAYSGDGGPASNADLNGAIGVATDNSGNVYIVEFAGSRIRKIDAATGIITTFAGTGVSGFSGDGGPAINAQLNNPGNIALDPAGNIFITDVANHRVRKISNGPCPPPTISIAASFTLFCYNAQPTFTATTIGLGTNTVYQWKKNGVNDGTSASTYIGNVAPGDVITCELTTILCGNTVTITSNAVTIQSNPGYNAGPEVTIAINNWQSVCTGTPLIFAATNVSGSANPVYQWLVNGSPVGTNSPFFSDPNMSFPATVECIMTVPHCGGSGGTTKDYSNAITVNGNTPINPTVSITASSSNICRGTAVTFTATGAGAGPNPIYQWQVNGVNAGTNSNTFTATALNNGDIVSCTLRVGSVVQCVQNPLAASNNIVMSVADPMQATITITSSATEVCLGQPVTFTAVAQNAGPSPVYQWMINGLPAPMPGASFTTTTIGHGDKFSCTVTPANAACTTPGTSNVVTMAVHPNPLITFNPSSVSVNAGQPATLNPAVQGTITSHQWTPAGLLTNPTSLTPVTTPLNATTTFQLSVSNAFGCSDTKSIVVAIRNKLFIPSAFTPNDDGKNDVFRIPPGTALKLKEFAIYDRWGNKIFSTTDISKGWDGTYKGVPVDGNAFVYTISGADDKGPVFLKGTFTLIR